jgi:hypothetical protein
MGRLGHGARCLNWVDAVEKVVSTRLGGILQRGRASDVCPRREVAPGANFARMRLERPDLADAFDDFVIHILADRIDMRYREVV